MNQIKLLLGIVTVVFLIACNNVRVTNPRQDAAKINKVYREAMDSRDPQKLMEAEELLQEYIDAYAEAGRSGDEIKTLVDEFGKSM